mmetsp:Transcript_168455/g.541312  ORF Transcript_168455/g.541312 Transcript_168455/m.541312 type:complete len:498 (+) Transcript_168455:1305-2798(+)
MLTCAHGPVADLLGLVRILCVCTAARDDVREGLDVGARGLESDGLQVGIYGLLHSAQCGRGMPNAAPCTAPVWPRVQCCPRVGQRLLPEPDLRQAGGAVRQRDGDRGPVDLRLGPPVGPQVVQSSGVARGRSEEITMLEGGIPDVLPGRRQLRNNSFPPHDGGVTPQEGSPFASGLFAPLSQCLSIGAHRLLVQPLAARPKIQSSIVLCHKLGVCRLVNGRSILPTSSRTCQSSWQHSPGCLQKMEASGLQHWHKLQPELIPLLDPSLLHTRRRGQQHAKERLMSQPAWTINSLVHVGKKGHPASWARKQRHRLANLCKLRIAAPLGGLAPRNAPLHGRCLAEPALAMASAAARGGATDRFSRVPRHKLELRLGSGALEVEAARRAEPVAEHKALHRAHAPGAQSGAANLTKPLDGKDFVQQGLLLLRRAAAVPSSGGGEALGQGLGRGFQAEVGQDLGEAHQHVGLRLLPNEGRLPKGLFSAGQLHLKSRRVHGLG